MSSPPLLLDANVLIAFTVQEHEHHDRVSRWAAASLRFALSPVLEGALVRYVVRSTGQAAVARAVLAAMRALDRVEFWPDDVSYLDVDLESLRGHRQVTDAYLVGLAVRRATRVATLDEGLVQAHPTATLLVPGKAS